MKGKLRKGKGKEEARSDKKGRERKRREVNGREKRHW